MVGETIVEFLQSYYIKEVSLLIVALSILFAVITAMCALMIWVERELPRMMDDLDPQRRKKKTRKEKTPPPPPEQEDDVDEEVLATIPEQTDDADEEVLATTPDETGVEPDEEVPATTSRRSDIPPMKWHQRLNPLRSSRREPKE